MLNNSRSHYIIPIILLLGSYSIYSFNLEGQPWHGDEIIHLAWGGNYFNLLHNNDFENPCIVSWNDCEFLFFAERETNYSASIRNFLVGLGQYLTTGTNEGDDYNWSCYWRPCWDNIYTPSSSEFSAGRFFSPIFGSLTIVLAFLIGKVLFNRNLGILFSLVLLFHGLWLWNSRVIMSEVYANFFIMFSILTLLYSFRSNERIKLRYFISSAIFFGFAINIKITSLELSLILLSIILLNGSFYDKASLSSYLKKIKFIKNIFFVLIFFSIVTISFVLINPQFYDNPVETFLQIKNSTSKFTFLTVPSIENDHFFRILSTIHTTLFPYFGNYYDSPYLEKPDLNLAWEQPQTYSSVPLTIFFFIGMGFLINKIIKKRINSSELIVLIWLISVFVFIVLTVGEFRMERYFVPLMFPIILIASYGMWNIIKNISNKKIQILFSSFALFSHSIIILVSINTIYFSAGVKWGNPLTYLTMQSSFMDPLYRIVSISFIIILFLIIYFGVYRNNLKKSLKHNDSHF